MDEKEKAVLAEKTKRKTHTSSAVKNRYNDKVYTRAHADLPKDLVSAFKEKVAANGTTTAAVLRQAIERYIEDNETATKHIYGNNGYTRIYAALPKDLVAKFKETVANNGTSTAAVFRKALEQYIENSGE